MTGARDPIVAWTILVLLALVNLHAVRIAAIYFGLRHFQLMGGESALPFGAAWACVALRLHGVSATDAG
jgi:hypothetical protein